MTELNNKVPLSFCYAQSHREEIQRNFNKHDERLDTLEQHSVKIATSLDTLISTSQRVEDKIDNRLNNMDEKIYNMSIVQSTTNEKVSAIDSKLTILYAILGVSGGAIITWIINHFFG